MKKLCCVWEYWWSVGYIQVTGVSEGSKNVLCSSLRQVESSLTPQRPST